MRPAILAAPPAGYEPNWGTADPPATLSAVFTGLVQSVGWVVGIRRRRDQRGRITGARLLVSTPDWDHTPAIGDSIAVSGCCLTVAEPVDPAKPILAFDVVNETLARTRLGSLRTGDGVNLEHSATAATLLGGHIVQGHVDGVGRVVAVRRGAERRVRIAVPHVAEGKSDPSAGDLMQYIVPKGSVCVDGVSLTVAGLWEGRPIGRRVGRSGGGGKTAMPVERGFEVALIPTTLKLTTLSALKPGDPVNLETDAMAKTIVHWLRNFGTFDTKADEPRPRAAGPRGRRPRA